MAKSKTGIRGMDKVVANLNKELAKMKMGSMKGLLLAAAFIRRDMEQVPPLIPVDTGNLRASWFTNSGYKLGAPFVHMGFSASYATVVHDRDWKKGKRPGSGPKFFESALRRNHDKILMIIASGVENPAISAPAPDPGKTIHTGKRGGRFYINKNKKKTYIKRK
jgi:hypothetical protein